MNCKNLLRQEASLNLSNLSEAYKGKSSCKIQKSVCRLLQNLDVSAKVGIYYPLPDEINTSLLQAFLPKIDFFYPVCSHSYHMDFYKVSLNEELVLGKYGIKVPDINSSAVVKNNKLDAIICPGMVFSNNCDRIGRGKGYYDRFLKKIKVEKIIGVCYNCQVVEGELSEKHDVKMDIVVTEFSEYYN